ncbi:Glucose-6-phosphate dehydrogenase, C-terminal domain [Paenibacillus sp. yr247]|nr:Glucose-6-phosphate dehydrogenase, C-terminal domain [Paenibacillus sp. yr247]
MIEFKEISKTSQATADGKVPNLLVIEISPNEGITLQLNTRDPQHKGEFMPL